MNDFYKFFIVWIIGSIFYPIGFQMVSSNNPLLIFFSFLISIIILILMIRYLIKAIRNRNNYEK